MIEIDYEDIEAKVADCEVSFASVLRNSGIPQQTWYRWKKGLASPVVNKLNQVLAEVEKLEKEFNGGDTI